LNKTAKQIINEAKKVGQEVLSLLNIKTLLKSKPGDKVKLEIIKSPKVKKKKKIFTFKNRHASMKKIPCKSQTKPLAFRFDSDVGSGQATTKNL
jgi:hypothetical protein